MKIKKRIKSLLDICCNNIQRSSVFFRIDLHFGFKILDANNAATYKQFIQNGRRTFRNLRNCWKFHINTKLKFI